MAERRVAVVTGGTGALGRAVVTELVRRGARVHVSWVREESVARLRSAVGPDWERVTLHQADVTSEEAVARLFLEVERADGPVEILTNLVGGFFFGSLEETGAPVWERMWALNATSAFLCCRAVAASMRRRGWGRIVNVAAVPAAGRGAPNLSAYGAAKAAVLNLTQSLAAELGPSGVAVNAVVPTIIDTDANRRAMPDADRRRWLRPDEIAAVVGFLTGDSAGVVRGTAVRLSRE